MRRRRDVYKMCSRKRRYTVREANAVVEAINRRQPNNPVHRYGCPFCRAQHVGHGRYDRNSDNTQTPTAA